MLRKGAQALARGLRQQGQASSEALWQGWAAGAAEAAPRRGGGAGGRAGLRRWGIGAGTHTLVPRPPRAVPPWRQRAVCPPWLVSGQAGGRRRVQLGVPAMTRWVLAPPPPPFSPPSAVKQRMKSVANIQKITKAMKMVAASKMRSAQVRRVAAARGGARSLAWLVAALSRGQAGGGGTCELPDSEGGRHAARSGQQRGAAAAAAAGR